MNLINSVSTTNLELADDLQECVYRNLDALICLRFVGMLDVEEEIGFLLPEPWFTTTIARHISSTSFRMNQK